MLEDVIAKAHIEGIAIPAQTEALKIIDPEGSRAATFFIADNASPELKQARREKREIEELIRRETNGEERARLMALRSAAAGKEDAEERRIRREICLSLAPYTASIIDCMDNVAELDFTIARAEIAAQYGGVMPHFSDGPVEMEDMVNPRVADALFERERHFTPFPFQHRSAQR